MLRPRQARILTDRERDDGPDRGLAGVVSYRGFVGGRPLVTVTTTFGIVYVESDADVSPGRAVIIDHDGAPLWTVPADFDPVTA